MLTQTNTRNTAQTISLASVSTKFEISTREIIRIQSISNYSKLFFRNGKTLVVARVLIRFEKELPGFVRVHRTHLINREYVSRYFSDCSGDKVELINGELIEVSRRKAETIRNLIMQVA